MVLSLRRDTAQVIDDQDEAPKKPHRRAGDADVLALAESLFTSLGKSFRLSDIEVLQTVVESYPDEGRDGAGEVVTSLNGLLNDFVAGDLYDREAVAVHMRAWRFMVSRKPDKAERTRILAGLREVRHLYQAA